MADVLRLNKDENYETKSRILKTLDQEGYIDKLKASLRSEVIRVLEKERKQSYGRSSKYLKQSELATTVTKKVVSNEDGLLCAEIIREFLQFYRMEHTLHVFVPEMSLSEDFPKPRLAMEKGIRPSRCCLSWLRWLNSAPDQLARCSLRTILLLSRSITAINSKFLSYLIAIRGKNSSKQASPDVSSPEPSSKKDN